MKPGRVIWLTGLPRSGKSTLARGLLDALAERGHATLWLDSDDLRAVMTPNPSYSDAERDAFYATVGHLARLGSGGGVTVVISATASKRAYREAVRRAVPAFVEIWIRADQETLRDRDVDGLYRDADAGAANTVPGAGSTYEAPVDADLELDSATMSPAEMVRATLALLG
jgi:adenylylsulfate kinase